MSGANRCLVVCRQVLDFRKLTRIRPKDGTRYVVASDDPGLWQKARSLGWIEEVCFIERTESYYPVARDVIRLLAQVNEWLESFAEPAKGLTTDLLRWTHNVEGGSTVQRIQDVLLLIRSYESLFDTYKASEVIIVSRRGVEWEDAVLRATAAARGIRVRNLGPVRARKWSAELSEAARLAAREAYYVGNILRVKLRRPRSGRPTDPRGGKVVLFQLCSSSRKHVENIVPVMQALSRKGCEPAAFCWGASDRYQRFSGADQVRQAGLEAHELEPLVSLQDIRRSRRVSSQVWRRAQARRAEFIDDRRLSYHSVVLGDLLWPSIRFFCRGELPQRIRYAAAVVKYLDDQYPVAAKFWGVNEFFEGLVARKQFADRPRPKAFAYWVGNANDSPYSQPAPELDLFLATNELQRGIAHRAYGIAPEHVCVVGQPRFEHLQSFSEKHSQEDSRRLLGLNGSFSLSVAYDPNVVMRGALSPSEQYQTTAALLDLAAERREVALVIKAHPAHHSGMLESQLSASKLPNVFLVDKNASPYHWLNATDLLVTKFSTLALEAMLLDRPVIGVLLDKEENYRLFGDAVEYLYEVSDLHNLLIKLLAGGGAFRTWADWRLRQQRAYLARYFCKQAENPAEAAAEAISRCISSAQLTQNGRAAELDRGANDVARTT